MKKLQITLIHECKLPLAIKENDVYVRLQFQATL